MAPLALRVIVRDQLLHVDQPGRKRKTFRISTSRFGLGTEPNSYKTPLGRHRICAKVGHDLPLGAVLKGRQWTGRIWIPGQPSLDCEDLVLTRVLWLDGLDAFNASSRSRYIYIHGTNQESQLGQPASHGCIRMRNVDVAELFDLVSLDIGVDIARD